MAKDLNPKCKQCRRAGEKLLLKGERCNTPKCAIVKRNIPPYIVRAGEVIKIKSNKREAKVFSALSEKLKNFNAPGWLSLKKDTLEAKIIEAPKMDMIRPNFNIQMIVEYYSR